MSAMQDRRNKAGLTAYAIAQQIGTNETRVYAIERGRYRPKKDEAARIAKALGCAVVDIFPHGVQS